jgi:poly(3-hydroxybutyrate) depolymerase
MSLRSATVRIAAILYLLLAVPVMAQPGTAPTQRVPSGSGVIEVANAAPDGGTMTVWTYRPAGLEPTDRIVFVMHGVLRNADVYRDNWIEFAKQHRFLLVVPEMTRAQFPGDAGYNFGNMVDKERKARPQEQWAWFALEKIFDAVKAGSGSSRSTYAVFGHSAGAQFVHRMLTYADNPRIDVAIAANAGWYTLPVLSEKFPYGLSGSPADEARVKANFSRRLIVLLGDQDTDPRHPTLRRDQGSDRQGVNRFERGQNFIKVAEGEARRLGVAFNWAVETVPGVAHDNAGMTAAAVRWLFPARKVE